MIFDLSTGAIDGARIGGKVKRENIERTPILDDKNSLFKGSSGEMVVLKKSGLIGLMLEDSTEELSIAQLKEAGKLIYIGSFAGIGE